MVHNYLQLKTSKMKRVTLILSLLLFCSSLVMSASFTDTSPPLEDAISVDYQLNDLEGQDIFTINLIYYKVYIKIEEE